jgi:hypothetical protein
MIPLRYVERCALAGTNYRSQDRTMTFKPAVWYPIAVVLSVVNVVAVAFTAGPAQPWHAAGHAALALAFGLWAQRLRRRVGGSESQGTGDSELEARLEALEADVNRLRQQLSETQERLDFAERLLARGPEARRVDPQR